MKSQLQGLTLIEVLIALAIIGIALTAVIKASTQTIHSTTYLQDKMIATWLSEKILNDVRVGVLKLSNDEEKVTHKTDMLGQDWYWRIYSTETANSHIKKVAVNVYASHQEDPEEDANTIVNLETYVYHTN